ncbi:MAG: carboxypeptidase-like regulatory domain-containing protein [Bacteroidota bacterium]
MNLKSNPILMMLLLFSASLLAQNYTLLGTVSDSDNSPLIGVNVLKVGTSTGTVTDIDGNYQIEVGSGDVLQFSYTGYTDQSITIGNQTTLKRNAIRIVRIIGRSRSSWLRYSKKIA